MSYQPRRIADLGDQSPEPTDGVDEQQEAPRSADTLLEKLLHRGGGLLAAVTVIAASGMVFMGASGSNAAAVTPDQPKAALVAEELSSAAPGVLLVKSEPQFMAVSVQYTTGTLTVRSKADKSSEALGSLPAATEVAATAEVDGDYRQIQYKDQLGWVLADSLSDSINAAVPSGTSMQPCSRGSAVENKLRKDTIFVYRSVCPLFPGVNSYGGWRAGGRQFHKNGRALDIMLTPGAESAMGWRIAKYLTSHAAVFHIDHVIFEQKIWTPSSPTWSHMADRGSVTANHFNHVHVAVRA
jgi:uncharacterized protein YgiM (DUF1202 family)